jgi:prepilin-type N-terminal cleavage/methylation domain-containing protein
MSKRHGFTLIELLIVIVIIGILAAIAIPKFTGSKDKAIRSSMISDLRKLAAAQKGFYADSTRYAGSYSGARGSNSVNFLPSQNNVLVITTGGGGSYWSATITNTGYNGGRSACGIFVGTTAPAPGAKDEGVPGCQ